MAARISITVLMFLVAIPIGLEFVIYDAAHSFKQLKRMRGFWISWASSTWVSFLGMATVEWATRLLDRQWSWRSAWLIRSLLQVTVGVLVPLAIVVAWNAGFFYRRGVTLDLEAYFESEFWLAAILLIVFNAICCLVLWHDRNAKRAARNYGVQWGHDVPASSEDASSAEALAKEKGVDLADLIANAAYIEVSVRTCIVYRMDGGQEVYAMTLDAMEAIVTGPHLCRIHRQHIVHRQSIAQVDKNLAKHACTVSLTKPYSGMQLKVGPTYLQPFFKWMESEGG